MFCLTRYIDLGYLRTAQVFRSRCSSAGCSSLAVILICTSRDDPVVVFFLHCPLAVSFDVVQQSRQKATTIGLLPRESFYGHEDMFQRLNSVKNAAAIGAGRCQKACGTPSLPPFPSLPSLPLPPFPSLPLPLP